MRRQLYQIYWKIRDVIAPTLRPSQAIYEDVLKRHVTDGIRWADLGCGHQVLPFWREDEEKQLVSRCGMIVGMDYDLPSLRKHRSINLKLKGDICNLPFQDNYFDLVTANMVVEHLAHPEIQFREITRVLKPGGVFLFHTPNAAGYPSVLNRIVPDKLRGKLVFLLDGRKEEDVFRTYYQANTREQITGLARMNGLEVAEIRMTVTDAVFAMVFPIAILELAYIRMLMSSRFSKWRTDIITALKKDESSGPLSPASALNAN
jgi:ubiquinone/menaquinone biosynthesis C-methylase UbiE